MDNLNADDDGEVEQEMLVICAGLGEEGAVQGYMKAKPTLEVSGRAMIAAARQSHEKICQLLLKFKADVNSEHTALALDIFVKQLGNLAVVPMFLQAGLSASSKISGAIFEHAADEGKVHGAVAVNKFLEYKLNPCSEVGYKGLQLAAQNGHEGIVKSLLVAKSSPTSHAGGQALQTASLMGQFKVVQMLLAYGADASSKEGSDALNCASHIGNHSLLHLLLDHNADPSCGLAAAAFRGNHKFVKDLLAASADAPSQNKALKEAARFGHQEIMKTLLRGGADTLTAQAGDSALRLAVNANRPNEVKRDIVRNLQACGARPMNFLPALLPGSPTPGGDGMFPWSRRPGPWTKEKQLAITDRSSSTPITGRSGGSKSVSNASKQRQKQMRAHASAPNLRH